MTDSRLWQRLMSLGEIGATGSGGVSRLAYSEQDAAGREFVMDLMRQAGLTVRIDPAANIIARRLGANRDAPPIVMGSHLDTVPNGGRFDGALGVLAALEVVDQLNEQGFTTEHPVEVMVFANEEQGLFGSRAVAGAVDAEDLDRATACGLTVRQGTERLGGRPSDLGAAQRPRGQIAAYLELHVEQGGVLEELDIPIGLVEGIVGMRQAKVVFTGAANHAGTTPMHRRRDALVAAAHFVVAVNSLARDPPGRQVITTGHLAVEPGAPNVIPGRAEVILDYRALDSEVLDAMWHAILAISEEIATETDTSSKTWSLVRLEPALAHPDVLDAVAAAAQAAGVSGKRMSSGAGHDAQYLARVAPMGMIFVPSAGGISHAPQEFTSGQDVERGADVLQRTLLQLDHAAPEIG